MTPINNKSLLHFIFGQMDKLDKKEILMELDQYKRTTGADIEFRNVEGKNFD